MPTAKVDINSELKRKQWLREGLLQASSQSFWTPYTGTTKDSIIYQAKNGSAEDGHTVVFDFSGNLSGKAIKGSNKAYGKGETKRKFSDKITVSRYRLPVDNGDAFDGVDIGDLSITEHADSRAKLGDLFVRFKDQYIFDTVQSLKGVDPSHTITTQGMNYDTLFEIEQVIKTSKGFTTGDIRRPLEPYKTLDGRPFWVFLADAKTAAALKRDAKYQQLMSLADIRGKNNRLLTGVLGAIGSLLIVEAPNFFGSTDGNGNNIPAENSQVEISGLRTRDQNNVWSGQQGYNYRGTQVSRNVVLGAGAVQLAFGKQPDYKIQKSEDFGITSESACEFWCDAKKTRLVAENTDYTQAKVADIDYGIITVDVTHR